MLRQTFAIFFPLLAAQIPVLAQGTPSAPAAGNEAGIVDLIEGGVTVTGADRRASMLKKGDALFEGDAILTAADGELHANLTDGAIIAVRPNTQLRLTRYQANGAASDTSVFNLVKGSFRSITGWIARTNPAGYLIRTPTSTLGVRAEAPEPGRAARREAFEQQGAQQQAERARQREALQHEREARQQQRREAPQQRREGRGRHEERRERP